MPTVRVSASVRTEVGKGPNRRLRARGMIPAVLYGGAAGARSLALSPKHITEIVRSPRGVNTIFTLEIGGDEQPEQVMIHDFQLHPLDHSVLHADFVRVDLERESDWQVPVHLEGESVGVKRGGHLEFVTRSLTVTCLPGDIPEHLPLEITELDYGATVRAAQIPLPEGIVLASEPDLVVVHVSAPKVEVEEAAEEAGEASADGDEAAESGSGSDSE